MSRSSSGHRLTAKRNRRLQQPPWSRDAALARKQFNEALGLHLTSFFEGSVMNLLCASTRRATVLAGAAAAAMVLASGSVAAQTVFTGYTDGCFATLPATSCTPVTAAGTQSASFAGLTYDNSTFNVTTSAGFAAVGNMPGSSNFNNLGSFMLASSPASYNGNHFDLRVTFIAPPGTTPGSVVINDLLMGSVSSTNTGGVFIDFDNSVRTFSYGSGATAGTFTFQVNDVSVTAGDRVAITGQILTPVAPVPEPETYALMMAGLAALGFVGRRRKSSRA